MNPIQFRAYALNTTYGEIPSVMAQIRANTSRIHFGTQQQQSQQPLEDRYQASKRLPTGPQIITDVTANGTLFVVKSPSQKTFNPPRH